MWKMLLLRRKAFLFTDFLLDKLNGVGGIHLKGDDLPTVIPHKDLDPQCVGIENQTEGGVLQDVVV